MNNGGGGKGFDEVAVVAEKKRGEAEHGVDYCVVEWSGEGVTTSLILGGKQVGFDHHKFDCCWRYEKKSVGKWPHSSLYYLS